MSRITSVEIVLLVVVSACIFTMEFDIQPVAAHLSVTISPSSPIAARNSTFKFTAKVTGGASPYQYQWDIRDVENVPLSTGTENPWNCSIPIWAYVGIGQVYVEVQDSLGAFVSTSEDVLILPISVSVSPASVLMDVGQFQVFNSIVLGGMAPFSYHWYLDGNLLAGATSASWMYRPTSAGFHSVSLLVKDATGVTGTSVASVKVSAEPSVSISPILVSFDLDQFQLFTSDVVNGTAPYSYQWYLDDNPVSGAVDPNWTFTPNSAGSYTVHINITDNVGMEANSNTVNVTVNTHDVAIKSVVPSTIEAFYGQIVNITVVAKNEGTINETFNVSACYESTLIGIQTVTDLPPKEEATLIFSWNTIAITTQTINPTSGNSPIMTFNWKTAELVEGNYTISAYASIVKGEADPANNNCTGDSVLITKVGDLGSGKPTAKFFAFDGICDSQDLRLFLQCYRGMAPENATRLCDLGGGTPNPNFFQFDGKVDSKDFELFLLCYRGLGPNP
jgi:hypothetical protein